MSQSVKFLNRNWNLRVTRNVSLFKDAIISAGYIKCFKKFKVSPIEALYIIKEGKLTYGFVNDENIKKLNQSIEKLYRNPKAIEQLEKIYYHYGKILNQKSEKLKRKISRRNYLNYIQSAKDMSPGFQISNQIGVSFLNLLMKKLEKLNPDFNQQEIDILISNLTYPQKQTPLTESQKALLKIGAELQKHGLKTKNIFNHTKLKAKLNNYINKFSFIPVNFNEEPWSEEEIIDQLEKLMECDCQKELEKILQNHQDKKKKSQRLLAEIKDREIKNIVKAIQVGTYLNEYRKYIFCHASLAYRPMFQKIAKEYNLTDWKECWKFTPDEIDKLYFGGDKKILSVLASRHVAGVCSSENKVGYRLLNKREMNLFLTKVEEKKIKKNEKLNHEIRGMIANKGIIRGTARIIFGKHEFYKFQEGDVIVTTMTSVDFVPLMKRASAYVTDEGGITSHAAIVSRELNKPCIVGTLNATQILKDGDLIEVDALKGTVRVIRNNSIQK